MVGKLAAALAIVATGAFTACNNSQGDTSGGKATDNLGNGSTPVSNGGFGAQLLLEVDGVSGTPAPVVNVGEIKEFTVRAVDPRGVGLDHQRVFCESEKGVAILEPSSGGVAFEHTNPAGYMSGYLSCITKGSFLLECRIEQGFNLKVQQHIRCVGEGTASFPGAAGGNLGGGNLVEGDAAAAGATGLEGATGDTGAPGDTGATEDSGTV